MRFLLDQGVGRGAAALLSAAGHVAEHVADLGLARADDRDILARARTTGATVVTRDADFHAELARTGAQEPSVVRFRDERLGADALARQLLGVITVSGDDLAAGAVVTVVQGRARVRRLPLV